MKRNNKGDSPILFEFCVSCERLGGCFMLADMFVDGDRSLVRERF